MNISSRHNIRGGKAQYPELDNAIMEFIEMKESLEDQLMGK